MRKGTHHRPETIKILAEKSTGNKNCLGRHASSEARKNMSIAHTGKPSPHRGGARSPEHRAKIAAALTGIKRSPETCMKVSLSCRGEKHPMWRGGISFEPYCPKFNKDLRIRIRGFFDYRCVACGKTTEENARALSCHHVEYNKQACCDGEPVHFAALCAKHHNKTGADRERWEAMLHRIIDEVYGGRSYFTKEEWKAKGAHGT